MPPYDVVGDVRSKGRFVFSCEHASNALPDGMSASSSDEALLADHWGWDIGAEEVARALVARLGGQAVLGGLSRLVIDLNRDPRSPDLVVKQAGDAVVDLNRDVDDAEIERRRRTIFSPYHDALHRTLARRVDDTPDVFFVSVHSFTPVYRGSRRELEVGVLFDDHESEAIALAAAIAHEGFRTELNQPYSGKPPEGLIYSAARHGRANGVRFLELEIRQDLIETDGDADDVAERLAIALEGLVR